MPGGDRTGPMGLGPMTGRAAGYCAGNPAPGFMSPIPGRGFWGRGRGRGWGYGYWPGGWGSGSGFGPYSGYAPTIGREQELAMLRDQAEYFAGMVDELRKRIETLESAKAGGSE